MKINFKNVSERLSNKEMKAVTGGGEDVRRHCCPIHPKEGDECVWDQVCNTDARCVELYGSNFACTGT